jgi:hypothetical protein
MIRDEKDRAPLWDQMTSGDLDTRRKVIQRPASGIGQRARREDLVAGRELARDPSRRRTERSPHGQAAGSAMLPSECLCPLMSQDSAELLDLVQRMPSTLREI